MIVVDASAMVAALRNFSPDGDEIRKILSAHNQWHAPWHQPAEIFHTFRGLSLGKILAKDVARMVVEDYLALGIHFARPDQALADKVWELRHNLSAYDALYVALAESLGSELLTSDVRIANSKAAKCPVITVKAGM
ncbi:type II toxin-antitoxin system VapC family toxin [Glycomyces tenuis]|uniref:type II toxin-antitoxin system VapC family toxin n=1 Tax=Glycomyces tenuis TaxID=58116 RepID=UPI000411322F|nr:type II toxin-antitoxin system VapC family toxin [Glycomyces tenuis]